MIVQTKGGVLNQGARKQTVAGRPTDAEKSMNVPSLWIRGRKYHGSFVLPSVQIFLD